KVLQWHAHLFRLDPIDVGFELRDIDCECGKDTAEAGRLITFANDRLHILVKRVVTEIRTVFDKKFESADGAQTHHRWRWNSQNERVLDRAELLIQSRGDRGAAQIWSLAIFKWIKTEENDSRVGSDTESADA